MKKFCYRENVYIKIYVIGSSCNIGGCVWWESWTESSIDLIIIKCYMLESKIILLIFYLFCDILNLIINGFFFICVWNCLRIIWFGNFGLGIVVNLVMMFYKVFEFYNYI